MDGKLYRQGVGKTKKDAKQQAAEIAFKAVVGITDEQPESIVGPSKLDLAKEPHMPAAQPAQKLVPGMPGYGTTASSGPPGDQNQNQTSEQPKCKDCVTFNIVLTESIQTAYNTLIIGPRVFGCETNL